MRFVVYRDRAGEWRWRLVDANNRIVADSGEGYASRRNVRRAIENVRGECGAARVDDRQERKPVAAFTVTPEAGEAPLPVTLDASASRDPDGSIISYVWDFGDGETLRSEGPTAEHTYAVPDAYAVTLTVTDDKGANDTSRRTVEVIESRLLPAPRGLLATLGDREVVVSGRPCRKRPPTTCTGRRCTGRWARTFRAAGSASPGPPRRLPILGS